MQRFWATLIAASLLGFSAHAQQKPVVIELFTSEGCSSCPPADLLLQELAHSDDILALSMHVDYWDYIGWKDQFASPANTERQRNYAHVAGRDMVYTPQMIINGTTDVVGSRVDDVTNAIRRQRSQPAPLDVHVERAGDTLTIMAPPMAQPVGPIRLQLVRYTPFAEVEVKRGENAGHKLSHANIVRELQPIAEWDGTQPLKMSVPIKGDLRAAVLFQKKGLGAILTSAVAPTQ